MKRRLTFLLIVVLLMVLSATPALAADPEPGTLASKEEVVEPYSETSEDKATPAWEMEALPDTETVQSPDEFTTSPDGMIGFSRGTSLSLNSSRALSRGFTTATSRTDFMRTKNYLCRGWSCTSWKSAAAFNTTYVAAGWYWSSYAWAYRWFTKTQHYIVHNGWSSTLYTSVSR